MKRKININRIANALLPVLLVGLLTTACKEVEELEPMRLFTPAGAIRSVSGETQVRLTWNPSLYTTPAQGITYTVEVAADTLFQTPVLLSVVTDTAGVVLTDEQLQVRQRYFARIRANALDGRPESKTVVSNGFMIRGEQIFQTPTGSEITDRAVLLRWRASPGLTRITLTPVGGTPVEVPLTEADGAARQKLIRGLTPNTVYRAEIFRTNQSKGIITFTTSPALVGNVIDLTEFTDRPSVLADTLPQIASGSIVVLRRGMTYTVSSAVNLSRSVTIMSENVIDPNLATIFFTSNFNVAAGSVIDSLVFRDVAMRSDNYGSRYVFNISNASTIRRIKFESSHAEIFRGIVRLQSAGINVNEFIVTNSVIDSVSNYGVLSIDHASATVNNIVFRNSTFYKMERPLFSRSNSTSILVENNTFNETPEATRYLIDYGSANVTAGIQVRNNIFGPGKWLANSQAGRGIRASSTSLIDASGNYATADYEATSNEIPNLIQYPGTSFDLFQDPRNGNFTLKDPAFAGRTTAGDPRWRP
ncbi:hypothetical protein BH24BAC1_BH24BAC1_22230 [soil metagenome]